MEFVLEEICHRGGRFVIWHYFPLGKFCHGITFLGGILPYGIISPWGSSALGFLPGEGLPYGIPSWGTFAIWYNFRGDNLPWYLFPHHEICVGGRFTIEGEALPYGIVYPLGKFCHGISFGGRFVIWYSFRGNVCHMVSFPGGGEFFRGEEFPCDTGGHFVKNSKK